MDLDVLLHNGDLEPPLSDPPIEYSWNESNEARQAPAESLGLVVVHPRADELTIDLDSEEAFAIFEKNFEIFNRYIAMERVPLYLFSKSGPPKRHVYLRLARPLSDLERVALQACLGSDATRELCGWFRIHYKVESPTLLFETLENAAAIEAWRNPQ